MKIRFASNRETPILPMNSGATELVRMIVRSLRPWGSRAGTAAWLFLVVVLSHGMLLAQQSSKSDRKTPEKADENAAVPAGGASVDPRAYRIGPEDVLSIRVWREPDLSGTFTVRPDGKITLPLCGEVMAGGMTPLDLTKVVKDAYAKLVNGPEIILQVESVRSKKYFLVGEVNRTGAFPLVVATTVLEAIDTAGGLKEFANQKGIIIIRGDKRIKFNYKDVIRGKNLEQNILLENGDHIVVR